MDAVDCLEQVVVKQLAPNGHFHLIEGVLQDKVAVQVVYPAQQEGLVRRMHSRDTGRNRIARPWCVRPMTASSRCSKPPGCVTNPCHDVTVTPWLGPPHEIPPVLHFPGAERA